MDREHNTFCGQLPTAQIGLLPKLTELKACRASSRPGRRSSASAGGSPGFEHFQPVVTGRRRPGRAAFPVRAGSPSVRPSPSSQGGLTSSFQPGRNQRGIRGLWRGGAEFQPQAFSGRGAAGRDLRDAARKAVGGATALGRVPATGSSRSAIWKRPAAKPSARPAELVLVLVGRVDQDKAAPLVRRHEGRQRGPAVEIDHPGLAVAAQRLDQALARLRFDFAGGKPVLRPQQRAAAISGDPGWALSWAGGLKALTISR